MAKKKVVPELPEGHVKARVLTDCIYGKPNAVVTVEKGEAEQAQADGKLDTSEAAVEYAESLAPDADGGALS